MADVLEQPARQHRGLRIAERADRAAILRRIPGRFAQAEGGTTLAVQTAQRVAPARCALGDGSVRRGTTVVTITRVVSATTGKTLERSTDAEICADDSTFHPVADPLVVLGLISTSTIIDRTEIR